MYTTTSPPITIGGYFELQLSSGKEYHPDLIKLNTGRNALEYILKIRKYTKIYIPYFTCLVLLEPLERLGTEYQFYSLDENLEPIIDFIPDENACFLYTNYFGVKTDVVRKLSKFIKNLVIDNSQAFFVKPIGAKDSFYSCRKFFGVPDGAYLSTNSEIRLNLINDHSSDRFSHLIRSIDESIQNGYGDYLENNENLSNNEILAMSKLSSKLLSSINYKECRTIRIRNFNYLHKNLSPKNRLRFNLSSDDVPMVYPFLVDKENLKEKLIEQGLYIATYWPNVYDWAREGSYELYLTKNLISIPIDHRYSLSDMNYILSTLKLFI